MHPKEPSALRLPKVVSQTSSRYVSCLRTSFYSLIFVSQFHKFTGGECLSCLQSCWLNTSIVREGVDEWIWRSSHSGRLWLYPSIVSRTQRTYWPSSSGHITYDQCGWVTILTSHLPIPDARPVFRWRSCSPHAFPQVHRNTSTQCAS